MTPPDEATRAALALSLALGASAAFGGVVLRGPTCEARAKTLDLIGPSARVPLNADPERLLGGLDVSQTLASGAPVRRIGLLSADRTPIVVPSAERLSGELAGLLAAFAGGEALDDAGAPIPPRALIVLDEGEGDDPPLPARLTDRLAFILDSEVLPDSAPAALPVGWQSVALSDERLAEVCALPLAFGVPSMRVAAFLLAAVKGVAALGGRAEAGEQDIAIAASLILAGRATMLPERDSDTEEDAPEPPPQQDDAPNGAEPETDHDGVERGDTLTDASSVVLDSALLAALAQTALSAPRSGRAGAVRTGPRGRPGSVRPGFPGPAARLALSETITAALPWQRLRGARERLALRKGDIRVRRTLAKTATMVVFCVDASGSQAYARMAEAKGAVERLLMDAYVRRDQVALVAFRRDGAEVLLPATSSLTRAKRALAGLPGGGGTPLAAGLESAFRVAQRGAREGREPTLVVLTDGRANVRRNGEGGRSEAMAEARQVAQAIRAEGWNAIVIDTAARPGAAASELAEAMGARYAALPGADGARVVDAVRSARAS